MAFERCAHGIPGDLPCEKCRVMNEHAQGAPIVSDLTPRVGKPSANDRQEGGAHYKGKAIQHWDYVVAQGLGYFEGQVTKYVSRWRDKNGMEDLKKARHFLDKLIEEVEAGRITGGESEANPSSTQKR